MLARPPSVASSFKPHRRAFSVALASRGVRSGKNLQEPPPSAQKNGHTVGRPGCVSGRHTRGVRGGEREKQPPCGSEANSGHRRSVSTMTTIVVPLLEWPTRRSCRSGHKSVSPPLLQGQFDPSRKVVEQTRHANRAPSNPRRWERAARGESECTGQALKRGKGGMCSAQGQGRSPRTWATRQTVC